MVWKMCELDEKYGAGALNAVCKNNFQYSTAATDRTQCSILNELKLRKVGFEKVVDILEII